MDCVGIAVRNSKQGFLEAESRRVCIGSTKHAIAPVDTVDKQRPHTSGECRPQRRQVDGRVANTGRIPVKYSYQLSVFGLDKEVFASQVPVNERGRTCRRRRHSGLQIVERLRCSGSGEERQKGLPRPLFYVPPLLVPCSLGRRQSFRSRRPKSVQQRRKIRSQPKARWSRTTGWLRRLRRRPPAAACKRAPCRGLH